MISVTTLIILALRSNAQAASDWSSVSFLQ